MFCTNCGSALREGQKFCENCGAPTAQQTQATTAVQAQPQPQQTAYQTAPPQDEAWETVPPYTETSQTAEPPFDPDISEVGILGCGFTLAARRYFEKYLTFRGRATRSEYWWVMLLNWAIYIVANWLSKILPGADSIVALALICPSISLLVRREHDIGRSGTRAFVGLIPLVGWVMLLVDALTRSKGPNRYGPAPVSLN